MEIVVSRPMSPVYRESDVPGTPPDLIVKLEAYPDCQFLCWRYYRANTNNHWKICRVKTVDTYTEFMFPFGCEGYNFNTDHIVIYEADEFFEYKR